MIKALLLETIHRWSQISLSVESLSKTSFVGMLELSVIRLKCWSRRFVFFGGARVISTRYYPRASVLFYFSIRAVCSLAAFMGGSCGAGVYQLPLRGRRCCSLTQAIYVQSPRDYYSVILVCYRFAIMSITKVVKFRGQGLHHNYYS